MLSKIERGERKAKKEQVILFADLYKTNKDELLTLWLADQVYDVVNGEDMAFKALSATEEELKVNPKRKNKK